MGFLLLAANGAACAADDGIPALLKFAEQRQAPPAALGKTPRVNRCPHRPPNRLPSPGQTAFV